MEGNESTAKSWRSTQVYGLAVICLLSSIGIGYLVRAPLQGVIQWHARGNRKEAIGAWQKLLKTNPNHPKRAQVEELLAQAKQRPENPIAGNE
jgi:hypothetical protein